MPHSKNNFFLGKSKTRLDHQKSKHRHYLKKKKRKKTLYLKGLGHRKSDWYRNSGTSLVSWQNGTGCYKCTESCCLGNSLSVRHDHRDEGEEDPERGWLEILVVGPARCEGEKSTYLGLSAFHAGAWRKQGHLAAPCSGLVTRFSVIYRGGRKISGGKLAFLVTVTRDLRSWEGCKVPLNTLVQRHSKTMWGPRGAKSPTL